jgi:ribonuclease HI
MTVELPASAIATSPVSPNNQTANADNHAIDIHCDGAGSGPLGNGSGIAWIRPKAREQYVERIDGLTNNQAEYLAFISALNALPDNTAANVFTDSQVMYSQFHNKYRVHNPELAALLSRVRALIEEKQLTIDLQWIRREKNLAGKLL